jgi:hypothetical protein
MISATDYKDIYISSVGITLPLPSAEGTTAFECYDRDVFTSAAVVSDLLWRLHTISPVSYIDGFVNPLLDSQSTAELPASSMVDKTITFRLGILQLGALRRFLEANQAYGNWTLLGTSHDDGEPTDIVSSRSLSPYRFGIDVDLDCGLRGFGPREIVNTFTGKRILSRDVDPIKTAKPVPRRP